MVSFRLVGDGIGLALDQQAGLAVLGEGAGGGSGVVGDRAAVERDGLAVAVAAGRASAAMPALWRRLRRTVLRSSASGSPITTGRLSAVTGRAGGFFTSKPKASFIRGGLWLVLIGRLRVVGNGSDQNDGRQKASWRSDPDTHQ